MTIVLMYHALYKGNDTSRIDAEDLPYAVSEETFVAHLDAMQKQRVGLLGDTNSPHETQGKRVGAVASSVPETTSPDIVITFDDGHVSNFDIAMPLLAERGLQAYLFVTSDFVGKRSHFCSAAQLKEMAKAGMIIGSHGVTHRFFDDLSDAEAERELVQSRDQLSEQCGTLVQSISFPGGRYTQKTLEICRKTGYGQLFGSGLGSVKEADLTALQPLNRVAIRRSTSLTEFNKMISVDPLYFTTEKTKQRGKLLIKRILGNRLYHGLYKSISAR